MTGGPHRLCADRQAAVIAFVRQKSERHPELRRPVAWADVVRIAKRDGVLLRVCRLSRPARLIRYDRHICIQVNEALARPARALYALHELCHVWRDDPGQGCYHADDEAQSSPSEEFADTFAWMVTSGSQQRYAS